MGAGRLITLLLWVLALSELTDWRWERWRSKHILRPGLKCGGLESKFGRGPEPHGRSGMGWSYLCLGYKRDVCFEVPN